MRNILLLASVLMLPLLVAAVFNGFRGREVLPRQFAIRLGLALMLFVTGTAHFVQTDGMAMLLPPWVPAAEGIILLSGVFEIAAAVGLLVERTARLTALTLVAFFILIFPANVWAAFRHIEYGGHEMGPMYLLARGPFQALLIYWSWRIYRSKRGGTATGR